MQFLITNQKHRDIYFIQKLLGKRLAEQFEALEFDPSAIDEMWELSRGNAIVYRARLLNAIKQINAIEQAAEGES